MKDILDSVKHVHFVGIGGSGMSPVAEILHSLGYAITGSDVNESDNVNRLRGLGIPIYIGHDAAHVQGADLVVYTAAVNRKNPELLAAENENIPLVERAKILGMITRRYPNTIAIAGTHGKTTTTSMLAQICLEAGMDPTLFIGGRLPAINANGRVGKSDTMICEACEFQDHYLEMNPAVAVILNVDADHLDYFGTLENVIQSFRKFAAKATKAVIANADDANTRLATAELEQEVITFGTDSSCQWFARNIKMKDAYAEYDLYHDGAFFAHISLSVPGEHNVLNSMAAAAAAALCGASPEQIAQGIADFHGAGRRFEFLGTARDVTVADDYAHHPTEVRATLEAAKSMHFSRVIAVHQPFTYSRTKALLNEFAEVLSIADHVVLSEIMGSREKNTIGIYSRDLGEKIPGCVWFDTFDEIADYVVKEAKPGDLIITLGCGDIYKAAKKIVKGLHEKFGE